MIFPSKYCLRSEQRLLNSKLKSGSILSRFLLVLTLITPLAQADPEFIQLVSARSKTQPFSDAVVTGDLMILSGQVGTDTLDQLVEGGLVAETHQIFSNIKAILKTRNLDLSHIVKCTVMMDDIGQWGAFNQIYLSYFDGPKPARSAFGADGLALNARLELECWARIPKEAEEADAISSLDRLLKIVEALF